MKYHFTHTSMAVIKKIAHNKCWQGWRCGQIATFVNCWWKCQNDTIALEDSLAFLQKFQHGVAIRHGYSTPRYIPQRNENKCQTRLSDWTKTCTWMFIVALLIRTRTWEQPKCSSMDKWVNITWFIYAMEY